jgi:hypothetical protein
MARKLLADWWRFALITSSISAFPGVSLECRDQTPMCWFGAPVSERRKNSGRFPVPRESHQRIVREGRAISGGRNRIVRRKPVKQA